MHHVVVLKAAHHVHRGIGLANVGQKLVAQALPGAGTGNQAGNVDKFDDGTLDLLRVDDGRQRIKPRIGHLHNAHIGLNGAKGVVLRRDASLGQRVEQGRFTNIGQAHDATFHKSP
jgi:hypothetical protein